MSRPAEPHEHHLNSDGEDSDGEDPVALTADDVYASDPFHEASSTACVPIQHVTQHELTSQSAPSNRFPFSTYFSNPLRGWSDRQVTPPPHTPSPRPSTLRRRTPTHYHSVNGFPVPARSPSATGSDAGLNGTMNGGAVSPGRKEEHVSVDWYTEGPGKRVGYDDLTAIDWTFEYAKERQRLRVLYSSATGLLGQLRRFVDASQIWWILILTGIATGIVAASIDVASDWLGDLRSGMCRSGSRGGKFYLNRSFCCWGLDGKDSPLSADKGSY